MLDFSLFYELVVSLDYLNIGEWFFPVMAFVDGIFYFMKILLGEQFLS